MRPLPLVIPLLLACRQEDPPRDTDHGVHVALEEGTAAVADRVQALEGEVAALTAELGALQEQVAELQAQVDSQAAEGDQ